MSRPMLLQRSRLTHSAEKAAAQSFLERVIFPAHHKVGAEQKHTDEQNEEIIQDRNILGCMSNSVASREHKWLLRICSLVPEIREFFRGKDGLQFDSGIMFWKVFWTLPGSIRIGDV